MLFAVRTVINDAFVRLVTDSLAVSPPAYLDLQDEDGMTALMKAMAGALWRFAELLLDQGADPLLRCGRGWTALQHVNRPAGVPEQLVHRLIALGQDVAEVQELCRGHPEV